jgi:bifunctional enzyme CysN/CysC
LEVCEQRDPKGLYKKARNGQLPNMTGINSPYEPPLQPTLTITNDSKKLEAGVDALMNLLHP